MTWHTGTDPLCDENDSLENLSPCLRTGSSSTKSRSVALQSQGTEQKFVSYGIKSVTLGVLKITLGLIKNTFGVKTQGDSPLCDVIAKKTR